MVNSVPSTTTAAVDPPLPDLRRFRSSSFVFAHLAAVASLFTRNQLSPGAFVRFVPLSCYSLTLVSPHYGPDKTNALDVAERFCGRDPGRSISSPLSCDFVVRTLVLFSRFLEVSLIGDKRKLARDGENTVAARNREIQTASDF